MYRCIFSNYVHTTFFKSSPEDLFIDFRERGERQRGRQREGEASAAAPSST